MRIPSECMKSKNAPIKQTAVLKLCWKRMMTFSNKFTGINRESQWLSTVNNEINSPKRNSSW